MSEFDPVSYIMGAKSGGSSGGGGGSSGGGVFIIHELDDGGNRPLDKTFQEIYDAWDGGSMIVVIASAGEIMYPTTEPDAENFYVSFRGFSGGGGEYVAESANDYPVLDL